MRAADWQHAHRWMSCNLLWRDLLVLTGVCAIPVVLSFSYFYYFYKS